jgi:hypothetical protein
MKTQFNEDHIRQRFKCNMELAAAALSQLDFCCSPVSFKMLTGWVFEQTVQGCLRKEFEALDLKCDFSEQASIGGRAKADLLIDKAIAIEIKAKGLFHSNAASRYARYRASAAEKGYGYLYLTLDESYWKYQEAMVAALGQENTFCLRTAGDWKRLIEQIARVLAARVQEEQPIRA